MGYINIISLLVFIAFDSKGVKNAIFSAKEEIGQYNQKKKKRQADTGLFPFIKGKQLVQLSYNTYAHL